MPKLKKKSKPQDPPADAAGLPSPPASRLIGPEDIAVGQWVTVAERTHRLPDFDNAVTSGGQKVAATVSWTGAACDAGRPLRVLAIALPYVFADDVHRAAVTLDLRRDRLARLPKAYGKAARRAAKQARKRANP